MVQNYSDFGLRTFMEECRHWQAMAEIELERRQKYLAKILPERKGTGGGALEDQGKGGGEVGPG
jgi:hypothetical protein